MAARPRFRLGFGMWLASVPAAILMSEIGAHPGLIALVAVSLWLGGMKVASG